MSVPGSLSDADSARLADLARGRNVVQIGGYCGRATAVIAEACKSLMVIEDYQGYPVSRAAVQQEFLKHVGPWDAKVDLIIKAPEDVSEDELGVYDLAYVDADRAGDPRADYALATSVVSAGGLVAWHDHAGVLNHAAPVQACVAAT